MKNLYILFFFLLLILFNSCSNSEPNSTSNKDKPIVITVTKDKMNCGETSTIQLSITTSSGNSNSTVKLSVTKNSTQQKLIDLHNQTLFSGTNTGMANITCTNGFTAGDTYNIDASFTDDDPNYTVHYAPRKSITINSPILETKNVTVEFEYMNYANYLSGTNDMINSATSSFNQSNVKVNMTHIGPNTTGTSPDFTWDMRITTNFGEWVNSPYGFVPYIKLNKTEKYYVVTGHEYTIIQPNNAEKKDWGTTGDYYDEQNNRYLYSFVFLSNIDEDIVGTDLKKISCYDMTMIHELMHQIGKIFDISEHGNHTSGENQYKCPLNESQTIYNNNPTMLTNITSTWPICDHHIQTTRNGTGTEMQNSTKRNISGAEKDNNKDILELFLTKTKYKLFEPIEVLFKYINTGLEDDSIYLLFDDNFDYMKFNLKDENGNIYNSKFTPHFDVGFLKPEYIVKPGDTLLAVMQLYLYGKIPKNNDSSFFGTSGYFPVGIYSGYSFAEILKSNNINFEIEDLSREERIILNLTKNNNFEKIKSEYPSNNFNEYISRIEVRNILVKVLENSLSITKLATAYENFINQYPNSFYSLYYLGSYLNIISHKNKSDIENNMQLLIDKNPSTIVSNYLNNNFMRKIIIDNILENKYKH
jgi:hypothetical protein